jgi:flagellar basal body-associated protein FliL|uniref:DUF4366 domain-containing protein n=1 Tax=Enterocloster clostridioformis TaxID=1531 RepID=UPI002674D18C|nr:DUF4366 domain-containing protein [Enterocloster clostridioformis]
MKKTKFHILTVFLAVMLSFTAFSMTAYAGGGPEEEETLPEETEPVIEPGEPLSEDTDIVTRDLLYDKATNKQFLTIEDRAGNIFYLVIDYDAPVNEDEEQYKTYFLNPVDTDDLAALAEESEEKPVACVCTERCAAGAVNMNCPVCSANMTECAGREVQPEPTEEPEEEKEPEPKKSGNANGILAVLLLLALAGGGGAYAYLKFVKNKKAAKPSADLDDYEFEDEDDEEEAPDDNGESDTGYEDDAESEDE